MSWSWMPEFYSAQVEYQREQLQHLARRPIPRASRRATGARRRRVAMPFRPRRAR